MTDHERLKIAFLEGKTLEEIGKQQGITRERARQILNNLLSREVYLKQLDENRRNRPHKTGYYKRICPSCNQEFSGIEYLDKPFLICKSCRSAERQLRNLEPYTCLNCGKKGVYKKSGNRERHYCSNKCKMAGIRKLLSTKSIT
jgi:hypothetical protein